MKSKIKFSLEKYARGVILFCILFAFSSPALAQDQTHRELYDDPEVFDCLSGAARNMLCAEFGPKTEPGQEDAVDVTSGNTLNRPGSEINTFFYNLSKRGGLSSILSALINALVNNPAADATAQDTQSETTIVLGSGSNIIAGFNDSGSFIGGANKFTGYATSNNGGVSWTDGGTLPTNPNGDAGDPVLARDNTLGRTYFSTLQFTGSGLQMFRSDNDGATWQPPVNGAPGIPSGFQDKEWIAVDNFLGSGNGNVYVAWRSFSSGFAGIRFTRSTDNGNSFGPSGGLLIAGLGAFNVQGAYVTVGTDHSVYVFWLDQSAGFGTPNIIRMRKSTDQGVSFAPAVNVATLITTGTNGSLAIPAGFRSNAFPHVAVNPVSGHLYVVYNDPSAVSGGDRGNIFFRMSTDGGATWSAAVKVNDDATTRAQYFPTPAVKPDGSGLSITWYDNRDDPADRNLARWGAVATISGSTVTFGPNFRISPSFPPAFGQDPVVNSVYMSDYDQMAADNSFFYTVWSDNRLSNAFHANQPDVRFAAIPMAGPGAIVDFVPPAGVNDATFGNGNGVIEPNECITLTLPAKNNGTVTATGIVGTITTSTPGVTIRQGTSSYPDLAPGASGANTTPYKVSLSSSFVCGTNIVLTLTITHSGGTDVSTVTLPTCLCPPTTNTGSIAATDASQSLRLFRDGVASSCASPKAVCPGTFGAGTRLYDSYTFTNGPAPTCVTITLTQNNGANFALFSTAYLGSFNPSSICQNYRADAGASGATGAPRTYQANVPANGTLVVVVNEVNSGGGIGVNYTLNVSGLICGTSGPGECCTIVCSGDINVPNDPGQCGAVVNYPAPTTTGVCGTVTCSPPSGSFFPVGETTVTCTAASGESCTFKVTVTDNEPPVITVAPPTSLWPPNHKYATINVSQCVVSVSDNCASLSASNVVITQVTSDESDDAIGNGDGNTTNDMVIASGCQSVQLRSEREGNGNGRVYTITLSVKDGNGNTGTATCLVTVPHDQSGDPAVDDGVANTVLGTCGSGAKLAGGHDNSEKTLPEGYKLFQNAPNPFNPTTSIAYALPVEAHVRLEVYDVFGQRVAQLVNERKPAGYHQVVFDASRMTSGMYFYRLNTIGADGKPLVMMKKMLVVK